MSALETLVRAFRMTWEDPDEPGFDEPDEDAPPEPEPEEPEE